VTGREELGGSDGSQYLEWSISGIYRQNLGLIVEQACRAKEL
jgi:hypothetical protein